jgi:hypothetical protein
MDRLGQTGDIASKQFLICDLLAGRLNLYLLHHAGIDDQIPVIDVVLADVWRLNAAEAAAVDLLLTTDQRIRYHQNLTNRKIASLFWPVRRNMVTGRASNCILNASPPW